MIEIRELREDDLDFLGEMLYAALAWRPETSLPPLDFVLAHPQVVIFHRDWGRERDTALLAEEHGRPVGVAWYRFFTEAEHERARSDGLARISLSVDADNPARRLYARLGYVEYEPDDGRGRMVRELA